MGTAGTAPPSKHSPLKRAIARPPAPIFHHTVEAPQIAAPPPDRHRPLFHTEGPTQYAKAQKHNAPFARHVPTINGAQYQTPLSKPVERVFRRWLKTYQIPFAPNAKRVDYDMRGYFLASGAAPHHPGQHFPDTFKTPYDTTFSGESMYATPNTPFVWVGNTLVDRRSGQVVFNG